MISDYTIVLLVQKIDCWIYTYIVLYFTRTSFYGHHPANCKFPKYTFRQKKACPMPSNLLGLANSSGNVLAKSTFNLSGVWLNHIHGWTISQVVLWFLPLRHAPCRTLNHQYAAVGHKLMDERSKVLAIWTDDRPKRYKLPCWNNKVPLALHCAWKMHGSTHSPQFYQKNLPVNLNYEGPNPFLA